MGAFVVWRRDRPARSPLGRGQVQAVHETTAGGRFNLSVHDLPSYLLRSSAMHEEVIQLENPRLHTFCPDQDGLSQVYKMVPDGGPRLSTMTSGTLPS